MYHDGTHQYIRAYRGKTVWLYNKKENLYGPLQLELPLPMVVDYPSREAVAAHMSGKHLIGMVVSPESTYYEIDLPLDKLEYC